MELHLRRGDRDQAAATLQKRLLHLTQQMQACMVCLLDEKLGFPLETSMEINRVIQKFESLFFHRTQLSGIMQVELFRRYGQTRQMIESLCDYLDGLNESSPPPNEILFPSTSAQTAHQETDKQLRQIIYLAIQQARQSNKHLSDPRLCAAMEKFLTLLKVSIQSMLLSSTNSRGRSRKKAATGLGAVIAGLDLYLSGFYSYMLGTGACCWPSPPAVSFPLHWWCSA